MSLQVLLQGCRAAVPGCCPQENPLWSDLTVLQHLEAYAAVRGVRGEDAAVFISRYAAKGFLFPLSGGIGQEKGFLLTGLVGMRTRKHFTSCISCTYSLEILQQICKLGGESLSNPQWCTSAKGCLSAPASSAPLAAVSAHVSIFPFYPHSVAKALDLQKCLKTPARRLSAGEARKVCVRFLLGAWAGPASLSLSMAHTF